MIKYTESTKMYVIEHTRDRTKTQHEVYDANVTGKLPAGYYRNESKSQDFGTNSLVWYHSGYDEFPGTVTRPRDYDNGNSFSYSITYTDEAGTGKTDASVFQGSLSSRE